MRERAKSAVGLVIVVVAALITRLPPYLNAGAVNSDAAVVGLQALAWIKRGEFDIHLWDANYQTAVDVVLAAGLFKILGPSPWTLYLVPYLGAAMVVALVFLMLRRGMPASAATLATLTVSFGSQAITSPMVLVVRQVMFLTLVLGLWLVHRASATRLERLQLFAGAACFGLARADEAIGQRVGIISNVDHHDAERRGDAFSVGAFDVQVDAALAAGLIGRGVGTDGDGQRRRAGHVHDLPVVDDAALDSGIVEVDPGVAGADLPGPPAEDPAGSGDRDVLQALAPDQAVVPVAVTEVLVLIRCVRLREIIFSVAIVWMSGEYGRALIEAVQFAGVNASLRFRNSQG